MSKNSSRPISIAKGAIFATLCTAAPCVPSVALADNRLATKLPATADATSAAAAGSLVTTGLAAIFAGRRKRK